MFSLTPAQLNFLSTNIAGFDPEQWFAEEAGRAGSDRRFFRIGRAKAQSDSYVLIVWVATDPDWNRFLDIARGVSRKLDVLPVIHAVDSRHGLILEEDLGSMTLKRVCAESEKGTIKSVYRRVLEAAARWHALDAGVSDAVATRAMNEKMYLWESGYFANHCVRDYFGCERMLDGAWLKECHELAAEAAKLPRVCMHRDFQSENILVVKDGIRFVDFQGARMGPAEYDLASLLLDPYVALGDEGAEADLLDHYRAVSGRRITARSFHVAAVQRLMQALGAFANLSLHKGRDWYRRYVPIGLERLARILDRENHFPTIAKVVDECRTYLK
ncbi:MAG: phosphotransferase [Chitinivibrionales bacterium]|nr:phosphotransferase [Chitinivibrionales bacterium]MBD3357549.1 phosphotransferase [Chitinivibrionales bacterium]